MGKRESNVFVWNLVNRTHQEGRRPVPVEGSEFVIDVDTVIMSLGTSTEPADFFYNRRTGS